MALLTGMRRFTVAALFDIGAESTRAGRLTSTIPLSLNRIEAVVI
jgi:hypothetical protein